MDNRSAPNEGAAQSKKSRERYNRKLLQRRAAAVRSVRELRSHASMPTLVDSDFVRLRQAEREAEDLTAELFRTHLHIIRPWVKALGSRRSPRFARERIESAARVGLLQAIDTYSPLDHWARRSVEAAGRLEIASFATASSATWQSPALCP
jgi:hypothetical protein